MTDDEQNNEIQYLAPAIAFEGEPQLAWGTYEPTDEERAQGAVRQKVLELRCSISIQLPLQPEAAQQIGESLLKGNVHVAGHVPPWMTGDGPPPPGTAA